MKKRRQKKTLAHLTRNKLQASPVLSSRKRTSEALEPSERQVRLHSLQSLEAWQATFLIDPGPQ